MKSYTHPVVSVLLYVLGLIAIFLLAAAVYFVLVPYARGAPACARYGVAAVCRDPFLEISAAKLAKQACPLCAKSDIEDAVDSMQINEGPYDDARALANDALIHVRRRK